MGLGFRVSGLGFFLSALALSLRVKGLGFRRMGMRSKAYIPKHAASEHTYCPQAAPSLKEKEPAHCEHWEEAPKH